MFTVITRTSGRPNFFARCRRSVLEQGPDVFHLVGCDDPADTYPEGDKVVALDAYPGRGHNLYFNTLSYYVPKSHPWVLFLDDDDHFTTPDALRTIREHITGDQDLLLWQVQFPDGRLVPDQVGRQPEAGNISGLGFCYHIQHWINWPGMALGDFFVISQLHRTLKPVWLPQVLTGLQAEPGMGRRNDLPHVQQTQILL